MYVYKNKKTGSTLTIGCVFDNPEWSLVSSPEGVKEKGGKGGKGGRGSKGSKGNLEPEADEEDVEDVEADADETDQD